MISTFSRDDIIRSLRHNDAVYTFNVLHENMQLGLYGLERYKCVAFNGIWIQASVRESALLRNKISGAHAVLEQTI